MSVRKELFIWCLCFLSVSSLVYGSPVEYGQGVRVGDKCPAFTFEDMKGQSRSLEEFKGKYVFIDVWRRHGAILVERNSLICKNWKRNLKDKISCSWVFPVITSCGGGRELWEMERCRESNGGSVMILLS